jgi:Beta-galactosidase
MARARRFLLLLALVTVPAATLAAPAGAAKRKVPYGFFGAATAFDLAALPDPQLDQQLALMSRSGIESLRTGSGWEGLEPAPGVYNFTNLDRVVGAAARHRILLLVNISASPRWASEQPEGPEYWRSGPRDPRPYAELMRRLVLRYGPRGTFWAQHPELPRTPVRQWQIWNEPSAPWFWTRQPWAPGYAQLLKASYRAIHRVDRRAQVITGGLVGTGNGAPRDNIRALYRAGAKGFFDAVAVHPFTLVPNSPRRTVDQVLSIVRRVRAPMRRHRDGRKPILLTEMTFPAALGLLPPAAVTGLETTPQRQAQLLRAAYRRLARFRLRLEISRVYWFAWATSYATAPTPSPNDGFNYSGLLRYAGGSFFPLPLLQTYAAVAATYQGCRKSDDARRCR